MSYWRGFAKRDVLNILKNRKWILSEVKENKMRFEVKYRVSLPHTLSFRLRWLEFPEDEEARQSRSQTGSCIPAAAPCLGADAVRSRAGCESGRAAGRPRRTERTTAPSHTTATPEDTEGEPTLTHKKHGTNSTMRREKTGSKSSPIIKNERMCQHRVFYCGCVHSPEPGWDLWRKWRCWRRGKVELTETLHSWKQTRKNGWKNEPEPKEKWVLTSWNADRTKQKHTVTQGCTTGCLQATSSPQVTFALKAAFGLTLSLKQ